MAQSIALDLSKKKEAKIMALDLSKKEARPEIVAMDLSKKDAKIMALDPGLPLRTHSSSNLHLQFQTQKLYT